MAVSEFLLDLVVSHFNLTLALLTILLAIGYWYLDVPRGIPPGPRGVPILGYLPFIGKYPYKTFDELSKKFGPLFSLYFGNQLVIILNDYKSIKEAFINQADIFSGRPKDLNFNLYKPDKYNIVTTDGPMWKDHRRFALTVLRDCGVGKMSIEPLLMNEIQQFLNEIKKCNDKPNDFSEMLTLSVSNNICILALGKRFEYDDPWFISTKRLIDLTVTASSSLNPFLFFPWLKSIPGVVKFMAQETLEQSTEQFKESMNIIIAQQKKRQVDGQRNHYVAAYIEEQKSRQERMKNDDVFTDEGLEQNMRTLMGAGTETTANTLLWMIIYMMLYPDVQKKVQNEIDEVVGTDRVPSWSDRLRTPYTEATIYEAQRWSTLVPLNIPHRNTETCEILGHKIPENSFIVANLWAVHNDPKIWGDPRNFRPERFLSETGVAERSDSLITFSLGKRQCPGENLARMELYLYFTAMLQKFTFEAPKGTVPSLEPRMGITYAPKNFKTVPILRTMK